MSVFVKMA